MKKFLVLFSMVLLIQLPAFSQSSKDRLFTDSLINEWNVRFNSDIPEKIAEILSKKVVYLSGDEREVSLDSVMENFVKKRMPIISNLKTLNEFFSVTKTQVYTAGTYTLTVKKSEISSFVAGGNYTFVWSKQKDGKFRIEYIHIESVPR